jgi:hypothetical protein
MRRPLVAFHQATITKIVTILGLSGMVSLMISPGTFIQQTLLGMYSIDAMSVYQAIHGENAFRLPSFVKWLSASVNIQFLLVSILSCTVSTLGSTRPQKLLILAVSLCTGLCLIDFVPVDLEQEVTLSYILENFISNAIGGVFVAFTADIVVTVVSRNFTKTYIRPAILVLPIICGFGFSIVVYGGLSFFVHLLPLEVTISIDGKASGALVTNSSIDGGDKKISAFKFLPDALRFEKLQYVGSDTTIASWSKTVDDSQYSLAVWAVSGCFSESVIDRDPRIRPLFTWVDIQEFSLESDSSDRHIQVSGDQTALNLSNVDATLFWTDNVSESGQLSVTQFIGEGSELQVNTDNNFSVVFAGAALEAHDSQITYNRHNYVLSVDGSAQTIAFFPPEKLSEDNKIDCKVLGTHTAEDEETLAYEALQGGLLIEVERTSRPSGYSNLSDGVFSIENSTGWVTVSDISSDDLANNLGSIDLIELRSTSSTILVNNELIDISKGQTFFGLGSLKARYQETGSILISGQLTSAWLEARRLNSTRWELLSAELQFSLIMAFFTMSTWLFMYLKKAKFFQVFE